MLYKWVKSLEKRCSKEYFRYSNLSLDCEDHNDTQYFIKMSKAYCHLYSACHYVIIILQDYENK
jgi:hypothetical protein